MELGTRDSFVVRTSHEQDVILIEVEAWEPERCTVVMARVTRVASEGAPVPTARGSWTLRGTLPDREESSCLPRGLDVREG